MLTPTVHRRDLRQHDHQVERPEDRRGQPGRDPAGRRRSRTFHRSDSSGTTDNFTKYLTAASPTCLDLRTAARTGPRPAARAPRARTASPARSRARRTPSATSSSRSPRAQRSAPRQVDNGGGAVERHQRQRRQDDRRGHDHRHRATTCALDRLHDQGPGGVPDRARHVRDHLREGRATRPRSTLTKSFLELHRQRRGPGQAHRARLRADLRRPADQGPRGRLVTSRPDGSATMSRAGARGRATHRLARPAPGGPERRWRALHAASSGAAGPRSGRRPRSSGRVTAAPGILVLVIMARDRGVPGLARRSRRSRTTRSTSSPRPSGSPTATRRSSASRRWPSARSSPPLIAMVLAVPGRVRHRAVHLALRPPPARRRRWPSSSTCSPPCPRSSSGCGAWSSCSRTWSASASGSTTTSAGSRSSTTTSGIYTRRSRSPPSCSRS